MSWFSNEFIPAFDAIGPVEEIPTKEDAIKRLKKMTKTEGIVYYLENHMNEADYQGFLKMYQGNF